MSSFAELGASPAVSKALARRGIEAPFPIQQLVIADAISGRDVLAKSRTGSGKTLAFGVPLVERIEGDYLNVVGLPAALLVRLLAARFPGTYGAG